MENVAEMGGVAYVNDSKSTNEDSVLKALESFPRGAGVVLIMGGKDKGFSFGGLADAVRERVRLLVLIGETARKIASDLEPSGVRTVFARDMGDAVGRARAAAAPGETVLLSPGCSSFDMFTDYKERGDVFKSAVQALR